MKMVYYDSIRGIYGELRDDILIITTEKQFTGIFYDTTMEKKFPTYLEFSVSIQAEHKKLSNKAIKIPIPNSVS
jgi:L-rhamnose isomerase